jgi:hypothetical protein
MYFIWTNNNAKILKVKLPEHQNIVTEYLSQKKTRELIVLFLGIYQKFENRGHE